MPPKYDGKEKEKAKFYEEHWMQKTEVSEPQIP
jgi:hypothetical protein